jgi:hypothetical protein
MMKKNNYSSYTTSDQIIKGESNLDLKGKIIFITGANSG